MCCDAFAKGLDSGGVRPERRLEFAKSTAGGGFARASERGSGQCADRLAVRIGPAVGASFEFVAVAVALAQRSPASVAAEPSERGRRGRQRVQLAVEASPVRRQRPAGRRRLVGGAGGRHGA